MNNEKGYTMVEILIAMAILAIMSAPVLNIFTDSIRINRMADDQYKSDFIAQKFIEDLRVNDLPHDNDTTVEYDGFSVNVVHKELINDVATVETEVKSNFTLPTINVDIEMFIDSDSKIALRNNSKNLSNLDLDPNLYLLKVESTSPNIYKTILSHSDLSLVNTVEFDETTINDSEPLTIRIFKNNNLTFEDTQKITFSVLNSTSKEVEIYLVNDQLKNIKFNINSSSKGVKLIRNLTDSAHISTNEYTSHDVEVTVSKNGTEYTKLKTVISK